MDFIFAAKQISKIVDFTAELICKILLDYFVRRFSIPVTEDLKSTEATFGGLAGIFGTSGSTPKFCESIPNFFTTWKKMVVRFQYILCPGICGICRTEKGRALGDKGAAHHCLRKRHQHKQVWHSARLRLFRAEAQDSSAPPTAKIVARAGNAMTAAQQWTTFTTGSASPLFRSNRQPVQKPVAGCKSVAAAVRCSP